MRRQTGRPPMRPAASDHPSYVRPSLPDHDRAMAPSRTHRSKVRNPKPSRGEIVDNSLELKHCRAGLCDQSCVLHVAQGVRTGQVAENGAVEPQGLLCVRVPWRCLCKLRHEVCVTCKRPKHDLDLTKTTEMLRPIGNDPGG